MSDNKFYYKVPDKPLYNIQEQVYVNQYNIEENRRLIDLHYETDRVIGELGIRIIGQRDTFEEIADIIPEQFGDAYAIGAQPPYDIYIWTRTSDSTPINEGEWFDIGPIAIQGEPGPTPIIENDGTYITSTNPKTGDTTNVIAVAALKGEPGKSTAWYSESYSPASATNYQVGDLWLNTQTGTVYKVNQSPNNTKQWVTISNIMGPAGANGLQGPAGPQGPQGPAGEKGPQGDVGGFINIWGILPSPTSLPSPSAINNLTVAYLVGSSTPYDLYVQVGQTSTTAQWQNTGPFNAATAVSVNGVYQNVWDADTKVDKVTQLTVYPQVYAKFAGGGQGMYNISDSVANNAVVQRNSSGHVLVPTTPSSQNAAINKGYAEDNFVAKQTATTTHNQVYGKHQNGTAKMFDISYSNDAQSQMIPVRDVEGAIYIPDSAIGKTNYNFAAGQEAVNKNYVDDNFVAKPTDTSGYNRIIGVNSENNPLTFTVQYLNYGFDEVGAPSRNGIPVYTNGNLGCAIPTSDYHTANKKYVDDGAAVTVRMLIEEGGDEVGYITLTISYNDYNEICEGQIISSYFINKGITTAIAAVPCSSSEGPAICYFDDVEGRFMMDTINRAAQVDITTITTL